VPTLDRKFMFAHLGWTVEEAVEHLAVYLFGQGYKVNATRAGHRVLMWKRDHKDWSTAHTGQRSRNEMPREWFTLAGPEADAVKAWQPQH
jgi:hypothetical protein